MTVGILGAGGMGNVHARQYRKLPEVEVTFFDLDPERGKTFSERWDAKPWASVDELLMHCDVVDICLPTHLHLEFGLKAISAGKALLIEKPIAKTAAEAMRLHEAAEKAKVRYMPAQVVRFFPEFAQGRKLVKNGVIGTPAAARTRRGGLAPTGSDSWFMDHARSGGVILDLAVHDFDWLRWTLGEVKKVNARSVAAQSGQGPDYALITLAFDSGAIAHVEATWMDPSGFRTMYDVSGNKGCIEFDSRQTACVRTHTPGKTVNEAPLDPYDDPYYKQISAFLKAVKEGAEPPVTGYDGAMAVAIAEAALQSAAQQKAVIPARL